MKLLHEVVRVVEAAFLVNSAKRACRYETTNDKPLAPGYYFALWLDKAAIPVYDRRVRYFGPFASRQEAQLLQNGAVAMGLAAPLTIGNPEADSGATLAHGAPVSHQAKVISLPSRRTYLPSQGTQHKSGAGRDGIRAPCSAMALVSCYGECF